MATITQTPHRVPIPMGALIPHPLEATASSGKERDMLRKGIDVKARLNHLRIAIRCGDTVWGAN